MKKIGLAFMLIAMLATPMLACGFPLPIATETGSAIPTVVCAEGEAAETCDMRTTAYQLMGELSAVSVEDMEMMLDVESEEDPTNLMLQGGYDLVVNDADTEIGADIFAYIDQASSTDADGTEDISGAQIIVVDGEAYTSEDGGETWTKETLEDDALLGLGVVMGFGGAAGFNLDLFSDPTAFSVTAGEDMEMDGQTMKVQTLTVDLAGLLGNPELLGSLLESNADTGSELGMDTEELGDPAEIAMMAAMLMPMMGNTEFSTTLYIGADDGLVHYVEHDYVFSLDMSAFDPETAPLSMSYLLKGRMTNHNGDIMVSAPADFTEGDGGLFSEDGLFGGDTSGLGTGLFE